MLLVATAPDFYLAETGQKPSTRLGHPGSQRSFWKFRDANAWGHSLKETCFASRIWINSMGSLWINSMGIQMDILWEFYGF